MAYLRAFGAYVPERVVTNDALAQQLGVDPEWIFTQSGIRERRYAAETETVASLGVAAAQQCLAAADLAASELGLILVASGSPDRYCPGPASPIAALLGLATIPAIDVPVASAGTIIALSLASRLSATMGHVLVIGSEIMSRRIDPTSEGKNTAILFGDGAGAALISPDHGIARIADSCLHTDGSSADALAIQNGRIHMDGGVIIRHASRRIPEAIAEVLGRNSVQPEDVGAFLLHQANLNLITRIAKVVGAPVERFYSNIERYGNTSSASMLIAASEWHHANPGPFTQPVVFSAFGVGLNWGALLALPPAQ